MAIHGDALQESTNTEGTGDLTLIPKTGFIPLSARYADTDQVPYAIENPQTDSNTQWEIGLGRWLTGGILERTTPELTWDGTTWDNTSPTALSLVGDSTVYVVNRSSNIDDPVVDSLTVNTDGHIVVPQKSEAATPTIAFGDGDTGFYEQSDGLLAASIEGNVRWFFQSTSFGASGGVSGPILMWENSGATNPTLVPTSSDTDTGIGAAAADAVSLIAGGIEGIRVTEASSHVLLDNEMHTGLVAATSQVQGQGALLSSYNEVEIVANANDTNTLPTPAVGRMCEVINHGANDLQLFPPSGVDLGNGIDISIIVEPDETIKFRGTSTTEWHFASGTAKFSAQMQDEDNTDVFVINAVSDFHAYHSNGVAAGELKGWTFDAGGAGTSHAISSIADAGGGDITVTTGTAHGLAIGALISQTNLADAAYTGFFIVKTVPSTTTYTVTAVFTATDTGTMDEAATLTVDGVSSGKYEVNFYATGTSATSNETFDFQLVDGGVDGTVTTISGSKSRRKFGSTGDFGSFAGGGIHKFASSDKIALAIANTTTAANITLRNFTVVLSRL